MILKKYFNMLFPFIIIIIIWQLASSFIFHPLLLPSPLVVFTELINCFLKSSLYLDLFYTLTRFFIGFFIGSFTGILFGLSIGYSSTIRDRFVPLIDFLRSIPATALIPIAILLVQKLLQIPQDLFGITSSILTGYVSFLLLALQSIYGIRYGNQLRKKYFRKKTNSLWKYFLYVLLPESLPQILSGFRQAASLGMIIVIVTEMFLGFNNGIGATLIDSQALYETPTTYAYIILSGILGIGVNRTILFFERKIIYWIKE